MDSRISAIIVAAGSATRYGRDKVLEPIAGRPALAWSVSTFARLKEIGRIVVVTRSDLIDAVAGIANECACDTDLTIVPGGARRQDSVAAGLEFAPDTDVAVVHDAARPLITEIMIRAAVQAITEGADAAFCAVPVSDTLKRRSDASIETIDRTDLFRAQTPQAFRVSVLQEALRRAERESLVVTDECALIEQFGGRLAIVAGDESNLKLTVPGDRAILEALMQARQRVPAIRTGIGYDVHRLVVGRQLVLGGVEIPHERGLDGHSDADVVLHAICDSILGACALGDIGQHFPPSDEAFRNISSLILLDRVATLAGENGFEVVNIDVMVLAEQPRIGPYVDQMRRAIARACAIQSSNVSIKATTNEGLGFIGRGEGIAAMATTSVSARD